VLERPAPRRRLPEDLGDPLLDRDIDVDGGEDVTPEGRQRDGQREQPHGEDRGAHESKAQSEDAHVFSGVGMTLTGETGSSAEAFEG
jgi:hypothetical protein